VPLGYALLHQGNSLLVLAASLWAVQRIHVPQGA